MPATLYLPFLDETIGYDCADCRAGCCKSGVLGASDAERDQLVQLAPRVRGFYFGQRTEKFQLYRKFKPKCWFLDDDNLCAIEKEHTREAKPYVCRSHPIYFRRFEAEGVTVGHFYRGCHWVTDPGLKNAIGTLGHGEAHKLHAEWLQLEPVSKELDPALWRELSLPELLQAEEQIRDRITSATEVLPFLRWLDAFTHGRPEDEGAMSQLALSITELLDTAPIDELSSDPVLNRAFLQSVPMLRLLAFPGLVEDEPALALNSREVYRALPRVLLALFVLAIEYARMVPGRRQVPNHDTFAEMLELWGPRLHGLSLLEARVALDDETEAELEVSDPEWAESFLIAVSEAEGGRVLDAMRETGEASVEARLLRCEDVSRASAFLREEV